MDGTRLALVVGAAILFLPSGAAPSSTDALSPSIDGALVYLENQRTDGHFDGAFAPLAAEAAVRAGHTLTTWPATHPVGLDITLANRTGIALLRPAYVLGLADVARHPDDPAVAQVRALRNGDGFGDSTLFNDDAWSVLALRAWGVPASDPDLEVGVHELRSHQATDGGWSWHVGSASDVDTTGMVLAALGGLPGTEPAFGNATAFLHKIAEPDGGYGTGASTYANCDSTVWALRGLTAANAAGRPSDWSFLATLRNPDGGFAYQPKGPSNPLCTAEVAAWLAQARAEDLDASGYGPSSTKIPGLVGPTTFLGIGCVALLLRRRKPATP